MNYFMPTKITFGPGSLEQLNELIDHQFNTNKIFLVTDQGIRKTNIVKRVLKMLPDITIFDEVEQNPQHTTIDKAGEIVRRLKPDLVIGLGGGSVLDAAKAIALLATNPGKIESYEGRGKYTSRPLSVLAIPTTCGTGSEVTWVAVITHTGRKFKISIKGPEMFPAAALVDPDLLISLPPPLIASTGLDALVHAIEAYTVKPATPITDIFAGEAVRRIFPSLEAAYSDILHNEYDRENIMMGSMLAGLAFGNSDVGSIHCISETIGALFNTPHGVANAIFLPFVMEYNLPDSTVRYADIARMIGIPEPKNEMAARKLIQSVRDLLHKLNVPEFKQLGIKHQHFREIAEKSFANNSNSSNPRETSVEDYLTILEKAASI